MKLALLIIAILAGLVLLATLIGALLPKAHSATRAARYKQSPEVVWQAITNVDAFPAWRPDVKKVERLPERNGMPAWRETDVHGQVLPMEVVTWEPPRKLVGRIADDNLPFGGTWTYVIDTAEGGSVLTITEDGEIYNPVFRFMARFVLGYAGTMEKYLLALGKKFGEQSQIETPKGN